MELLEIIDPRDPLEKATRFELADFAKANGLTHVTDEWPAPLIRKELRKKGLINIPIPNRQLGQGWMKPTPEALTSSPSDGATEIDADDFLAAQFQQQQQSIDPMNMDIRQVRSSLKQHGVKAKRTDNLNDLRQKLQDHLNGQQNAA